MIGLGEILAAQKSIEKFLRPSPLVASHHLSERLGVEIYLKLESLQVTGSFKVRGALTRLLHLSIQERSKGVIAASAGNHAQGVAWAASRLGILATIFMPRYAPIAKVLATRGYGAEVIRVGEAYDECAQEALQWARDRGATLIPAFDDEIVVAGQGTVGLEICEQIEDIDFVIVPAGGGGLLAGIAIAVKSLKPKVKVIGVQSLGAPALSMSWKRGQRQTIQPSQTIADGIAVASPGAIPFAIIKDMVDSIFAVQERFIEEAIVAFLERKHLVVEGAGATPLGLLLQERDSFRGSRVVLVVSGGNLDLQWLDRLVQRGAMALGRRVRLKVVLRDVPGALAEVTAIIARTQANILQVFHDRLAPGHPLHLSEVEFDLEVEGPDHIQKLRQLLEEKGVKVLG